MTAFRPHYCRSRPPLSMLESVVRSVVRQVWLADDEGCGHLKLKLE
jgi:hypothetical protein